MPLTVLVVDDVPDIVDTVVMVLDLHGFSARGTYDVATALADATAATPDVVLTDLSMPGMDGVELIRELRRLRTARRLVLILETAFSDEARHRRAIEAGADAILLKPVQPAELVALLKGFEAELYPPGDRPPAAG